MALVKLMTKNNQSITYIENKAKNYILLLLLIQIDVRHCGPCEKKSKSPL